MEIIKSKREGRRMIYQGVLPFIKDFIEEVSKGLEARGGGGKKLSKKQKGWLGFCIMGILMTNKLCWEESAKRGLGRYSRQALSWMFRRSKLDWEGLLTSSIQTILEHYELKEGLLVGDDCDRERSKGTKRIFAVHKVYDKKRGGWFKGQTVVMLLLVTEKVTLPVGFKFYQPDPLVQEWRREEKRLKKQGVKKEKRPQAPASRAAYPSKQGLMLRLLEEFKKAHPDFNVKAVLVDAGYGSAGLMKGVNELFPESQVISQLRRTQKVRFRNQEISVEEYFARFPGVEKSLSIRGRKEVPIIRESARLFVKAQKRKCFIVALKYEAEKDFRYLVATDLSWRSQDIAAAYTLRWLIEVFIEDWKLHEGWGQCAPQYDEEGSRRGLSLSLLVDYALLLHPEQTARLENNLPAYTVGSLKQKSQIQALIETFRTLLETDNPSQSLNQIAETLQKLFPLRDSSKHMSHRCLGRLDPTPSLKYRAAQCMT